MSSVTMECPVCAFRRVIREGEPYTQTDLMCPNDTTALVIVTTSSEATAEPELPLAEAGPVANETGPNPPDPPPAEAGPAEAEPEPLSPEALALRIQRIMTLEKDIRDLEIVFDRKHKQAKDAKADVESATKSLLAYIRECRVPKILPLFDKTPPTEAGAADVAGLAMQQIIDGEQALKTAAAVELEGQIENHVDDDVPASELEPAKKPRRKAKGAGDAV